MLKCAHLLRIVSVYFGVYSSFALFVDSICKIVGLGRTEIS